MKPRAAKTRVSRLARPERMAEILSAAREVIALRGYEGTVVAEVAARANVVEGTIYRYFDSKRDLFVRVAEDWFEEILRQNEPMQSSGGTLDRLRHMIWRALFIIRQQPALTRFVLMELRPDPLYRSMRLYELNRKFTAGVSAVLKDAIDGGEFRGDIAVRLIRDMIFGAIEHQTWAYLRNEGDFSVDDAANGIAEIIHRGMTIGAPTPMGDGSSLDRLEAVATRLERLERAAGDQSQ